MRFIKATKHGRQNSRERKKERKKKDCCGRSMISIINLLLSSYCVVYKDIIIGEIMNLSEFVDFLGSPILHNRGFGKGSGLGGGGGGGQSNKLINTRLC